MRSTNSKLKAFVRYDRNGRIVPGSLIVQSFKPKVGGKWKEIPYNICCAPSEGNFLLQENGDYILQEDGGRIIL